MEVYRLENVDSLKPHESYLTAPDFTYLSPMYTAPPNVAESFSYIGDITAFKYDFYPGNKQWEHLIGLYEQTAYVLKVEEFSNSATLKTFSLVPAGDVTFGVFGAAFHFQNEIFFACNQKGMIYLDKDLIDYNKATAVVETKGPSEELQGNDGMSCHDRAPPAYWFLTPTPTAEPTAAPTPTPTRAPTVGNPLPLDCPNFDGDYPWQNVYSKGADGLSMKILDFYTGTYSEQFFQSPLKNACDISPKDYAYCMADLNGVAYLARFGRSTTVWVAKLPCFSFAATFGSTSDTFYFSCQSTSSLYVINNVDDFAPKMTYTGVADLSAKAPLMNLQGTPEEDEFIFVGDFTAFKRDYGSG